VFLRKELPQLAIATRALQELFVKEMQSSLDTSLFLEIENLKDKAMKAGRHGVVVDNKKTDPDPDGRQYVHDWHIGGHMREHRALGIYASGDNNK
jgi:hypothetical protein